MILDTLDHLHAYRGLFPGLDTAIRFLQENDLHALAGGRHEIDGDRVYVNASKPQFKPAEQIPWEAHRRYADIHVALAPGETIGYLPLKQVGPWQPYNETGDALLSSDPQTGHALRMEPGSFAVFFPWDAHRPNQGEAVGHKLVVKVRMP